MPVKTAILPLDTKGLSDGGRTICGYASTFGNVDHVGEVVLPGAFTGLKQGPDGVRNDRGELVRSLWNHNHSRPIGKVVAARIDAKGLYVECELLDTADGNDALKNVQGGAWNALSIGYRVKKRGTASLHDGTKAVALVELGLDEVSPVTFPANPEARITGVKEVGEVVDTAPDTPDVATAPDPAPNYRSAPRCGSCAHFTGYSNDHPPACLRHGAERDSTHVCDDWASSAPPPDAAGKSAPFRPPAPPAVDWRALGQRLSRLVS